MKILFTNEVPLIKYGLAEGFKQCNHEVKVIQGESERIWGQPLQEQIRRMKRAIAKFRPDLVFSEGFPGFDLQKICEITKKYDIPHFYWAIEDPVCTDLSLSLAPMFDFIFTTTVECIPRYQAIGKKAELLLFGCNPEFHYLRDLDPKYQYDLVLVGSNYSSRYEEVQWFIMPLIEQGYDLKIWGVWWDDPERPVNLCNYPHVYGGVLPYEQLPVVYSSAKIILGVNCDDSSMTQTSMRPYEALACGGGLYIGHYTKAQAEIFGDLIFQPHNAQETLALADKLIQMSEVERMELAHKAQQFVYSHHSYQIRAQQILNVLNKL